MLIDVTCCLCNRVFVYLVANDKFIYNEVIRQCQLGLKIKEFYFLCLSKCQNNNILIIMLNFVQNKTVVWTLESVWSSIWLSLTCSWRRSLSYRNQSINLLCKLMDWFLYDREHWSLKVNQKISGFDVWQDLKYTSAQLTNACSKLKIETPE